MTSKSIEIRAGTYRGGIAHACQRFAAHCHHLNFLCEDCCGCEGKGIDLGFMVPSFGNFEETASLVPLNKSNSITFLLPVEL